MHNLFLYMAIMSPFGVRKEKNNDETGMRREGGRGSEDCKATVWTEGDTERGGGLRIGKHLETLSSI